jgi:hypothetical protein
MDRERLKAAVAKAIRLAREAERDEQFVVVSNNDDTYEALPAYKSRGYVICRVTQTGYGIEVIRGHGYSH